jgi:hypothetical protein
VFIVERAMINPRIMLHHHAVIWKKRSPVLSVEYYTQLKGPVAAQYIPACQAFRQQSTVATIHGGLDSKSAEKQQDRHGKVRCEKEADSSRETKGLS